MRSSIIDFRVESELSLNEGLLYTAKVPDIEVIRQYICSSAVR